MVFTIQLRSEEARLFQAGAPTDRLSRLLAELRELGAHLQPMHPGADDLASSLFFTATLDDERAAEKVRATLLDSELIDGVYVKPPDERPIVNSDP